MKVARLTISDRASAGVYADKSGPEIERVFHETWKEPCDMVARIIPDERENISRTLAFLADQERCDLILTTGGTGPARRDVTPEATRDVIEKELPGFGEAQRALSFRTVPTAILSRAIAGVRGRSLIINLPGNPKAIAECFPPLVPAIREALRHLQNEHLRGPGRFTSESAGQEVCRKGRFLIQTVPLPPYLLFESDKLLARSC